LEPLLEKEILIIRHSCVILALLIENKFSIQILTKKFLFVNKKKIKDLYIFMKKQQDGWKAARFLLKKRRYGGKKGGSKGEVVAIN